MSWVVDSCVLLDIVLADPAFAEQSAAMLDRLRPEGLVVCPVTLVEISPALDGNADLVEQFCDGVGIPFDARWDMDDTRVALRVWHTYVMNKRAGLAAKRPIADILVGAYALRRSGLITRNTADFVRWFGNMKLMDPVG